MQSKKVVGHIIIKRQIPGLGKAKGTSGRGLSSVHMCFIIPNKGRFL